MPNRHGINFQKNCNMDKITFNDVPNSYPLCAVNDCPMADHCLRQKAMQMLTMRSKLVTIVNPRLTQPSADCEFYRTDEPQTFARGFAKMKERMLPRQYSVFMNRLQERFGRTGYFERRRGERLCSPSEITYIRNVLSELGLSHLSFDGYIEQYNWSD